MERPLRAFGVVCALVWLVVALPDFAHMRLGWLAFFAGAMGLWMAFPALATRYLGFLLRPRPVTYAGIIAALAFVISVAFVYGPMANKPVSIDANVYLFEARMLSHGDFGAAVPSPHLAYSGRFLFEGPDGRLFGVFPPGYPLFLAPFVLIGMPLLAGPVTAILWVFGQDALGRAVVDSNSPRDELGHRLGLLLPLFMFERTLHTADLLSHAFVAALGAFALAAALDIANGRGTTKSGVVLGVAIGWIFSARLLDGVLIGLVLAAVIISARRRALRSAAIAIVCALPFVLLLAMQQKVSTGSASVPTQSEYFLRSDWPPTCHRIGFGKDIGCSIEHPDAPEKIGPDGYGLDDAFRVVRERGTALGKDLFGVGLFGALAFLGIARRPRIAFVPVAAMALIIVLGYGLFYFGNVQWYGGRHILPAAPFLYVLFGHAIVSDTQTRASLALAPAITVTMIGAGQWAWTHDTPEIEARQNGRSDVRRTIAKHHIDKAIFRSSDGPALIAAIDPVVDGDRIHPVPDDRSGLVDLRRFHPDLPLILSLEHDEIGKAQLPPPAPGILVELERAWPSFVRPSGLLSSVTESSNVTQAKVSGGRFLSLSHAEPGATLRIPFEVAREGTYVLRIDHLVGPEFGRYTFTVDGTALPPIDGYADAIAPKRGTDSTPIALAAGRHELAMRCDGKNESSRGFGAGLDALVGVLK